MYQFCKLCGHKDNNPDNFVKLGKIKTCVTCQGKHDSGDAQILNAIAEIEAIAMNEAFEASLRLEEQLAAGRAANREFDRQLSEASVRIPARSKTFRGRSID